MMFLQKMEHEINQLYETCLNPIPCLKQKVEDFLQSCSQEEASAMKYLYASMPVSDAIDHEPEFFLAFVRHALMLQENRLFEAEIPEDIFAEYVLHHRIGNESLSDSRLFFFGKVSELVRGMHVQDAMLIINRWCASIVSYRSTDDRTASAEEVFKAGYGRCGEESVFVCSVLRSVGIPARQIYVPYWSHCDDNHAWVEAWCDGAWYYLGACEPEPVLNKGWFTNAASRAMMIHSRSFFHRNHKEEITGKDGGSVSLNHLHRYAKVVKLIVNVTDMNGNPVPNAIVRFAVLNYAFHAQIASVECDSRGKAELTTGLGSLHISAEKHGAYGEAMADTRNNCLVHLVLGEKTSADIWEDTVFYAPSECIATEQKVSAEAVNTQKEMLLTAAEDRRKREMDFLQQIKEGGVIEKLPENERDRCLKLLQKSRGNYRETARFLEEIHGASLDTGLKLLESLGEKDLVSVKYDTLMDHLTETERLAGKYPDAVFHQYVLCPKVEYEQIQAYRRWIRSWLETLGVDRYNCRPIELWNWLRNNLIASPDTGFSQLVISPINAIRYRYGDDRTKRIVFIQILRTLGVASRLNSMDQSPEIWDNGSFVSLEQLEGSKCPVSGLELISSGQDGWIYFQNWTIEKWQDRGYQVLHLCDESGAAVRERISLDPGCYRITTANRIPNGSVYARTFSFSLGENEVKQVCLSRKEARTEELFVHIRMNDFMLARLDGTTVPISGLVRNRKCVLIWLKPAEEPTEHILNEIIQQNIRCSRAEGDFYFILQSVSEMENETLKRAVRSVPKAQLLINQDGEERIALARKMYLNPDIYPMVVIADQNMYGIYGTAGYNVGTAEMILKLLQIKQISKWEEKQ